LELAKRGPNCTVCQHEKLSLIDVGLVHKVPMQALADRFDVSKDAICRHATNHLSPVQRAAILAAQKPTAIDLDALRASESEGLLAQLVTQRARLQGHAELAASLGDVRGAVSAEGAITSNLALVGRLLGQLVQVHDVRHTSILISADYIRLRSAIVAALRPFPEAARAVGAALHALEADAARDITAAAGRAAKSAPALIEHEATAPVPARVRPLPPPPC
jgi:hypothetical protein